ncbi:MAG: Rpn family recombination-promoting nuclease/putative transposase [Polyangiaceae bacterium]|nr:Rpn family recombination-promoting nuclease/putative transposase [Polyangiaceae bacterium]
MGKKKSPRGGADWAGARDKVSAPHNSFFAYVFGQKRHAVGLLKAILPSALTERLDWDALQREPVSYVDARLRWLHSDLVFSVTLSGTGQRVLIYILVEHQRRVDRLMAYRLLRYLTRVWGGGLSCR